jgi:hypothetical protein
MAHIMFLEILKLKEIKLPSTSVQNFMNAFFILGVSFLIMCDLVVAKSTSIPKDMLVSFGVNFDPLTVTTKAPGMPCSF